MKLKKQNRQYYQLYLGYMKIFSKKLNYKLFLRFMKIIKKLVINSLLVISAIVVMIFVIELLLIWNDFYKKYPNPYNLKINNINYNIYVEKKNLQSQKKKNLYFRRQFYSG